MIRNFTPYLLGLAICIASIHTTHAQKIYTAVGGLKDGGPATAAQLLTPTGLSIDADDNLYISEVDSYVIRKVDAATGTINIIAGNQVKWIIGDNGPALSASLASPVSVAVHPVTGDVYSVDQLYHFIRKIDQTNGNIYRVAGDGGVASFSGDGLEAIHGRFATPQGIAIAANGDIYIADASNQRIRKIDGATGIINTVAGTGEVGFSGDGGLATDAVLNFPTAVAVDEDNNFYIHDQGGYRIRRVDATSGNISTIAGDGTNGFTGDGGDAIDARISNVGGIVIHGGALYFTDQGNFRIRRIDFSTGDISTIVGTGENGYGGDGNDPLLAKIGYSGSLVFDSHGDLIFADFGNNRIRKVSGGVITTIVGHGYFYGDDGPVEKASIMDPSDVAFDEDGNMYIADQSNFRIRKVNGSSVISTIAGNGNNNLGGEGVDAATITVGNVIAIEAYDGSLYFLEDCRIRKLDLTTNLVTTAAGSGCGFSGDGGQATAAEFWPADFAVSSDGIMFISDTYNARIRRVDLSTGIITTLAGDGTQGYSGDVGQAANAQLNYPFGIDVDPAGENLYFADINNSAIRKVDLTTGVITTVAGTGVNGGVNLPAPGTSAMLANPSGVLALANGNLLIVQREMIFELDQSDGLLRNFIGIGLSGASGDGGLAINAAITAPQKMIQHSNGDIYITDAGNERIRKVVLPPSQTITFELSSPVAFGSGDIELEATASSGLSVYFESSDNSVAEIINSATVRINGVGTVDITARQAGNADFARTSAKRTLVVDKGPQVISFEYIDELVVNDQPPALEATSSSGLTVLFSSSNEAVATVEGSVLTITGIGTTTITASQPGNSSYNPAVAIEQTLIVNKADQTITFDLLSIKDINDDDFDLVATSTSELVVSYSSSNPDVATVSGTTVSIVGIGSTTITASQAGNSFFNAAEPVDQILVIKKDSQEIEFGALAEKVFGDDPFDLVATSSSDLAVTFTSSDPAVATINGATVTITGAGTTTITAGQPGNAIYDPAPDVEQVLIVNKAEQEITFAPLSSRQFNDDDFDLAATSSSDLSVSYQSSDPAVATVSGATISIVGVGTTTITASQSGNANYNAASQVEETLVIQKDDQEITFLTLSGKTFGDDAFDLTAASSSDLQVTFTSSEAGVATINGATVSIVGAGTTTITASQEGNGSYNTAVSITRTLEVAKAAQVITFNIADKTLGIAPFALEATSTSGLPVSYSSTSDKMTINGNTATLVKAGRAIVVASQEGNDNYEAAEVMEQSFCINPAKPAITAGTPGEEVTLTSSNDNGNQWYEGGDAIDGAVASTFTTAESGSFTVQTTIEDCTSALSDTFVLIVTGINARSESGMKIYPNPSSDFVIVEVKSVQREELSIEVFDAVGRLVQSQNGSTNTAEQLDLSAYGVGMYRVVARSASARYSGSVLKK